MSVNPWPSEFDSWLQVGMMPAIRAHLRTGSWRFPLGNVGRMACRQEYAERKEREVCRARLSRLDAHLGRFYHALRNLTFVRRYP